MTRSLISRGFVVTLWLAAAAGLMAQSGSTYDPSAELTVTRPAPSGTRQSIGRLVNESMDDTVRARTSAVPGISLGQESSVANNTVSVLVAPGVRDMIGSARRCRCGDVHERTCVNRHAFGVKSPSQSRTTLPPRFLA